MNRTAFLWPAIILAAVCFGGCATTTSLEQYIQNGYKVGPNYCTPPAAVSQHWIDTLDKTLREDREVPCRWWTVFNDPVLNSLVWDAYQQNLTLKEAGARILQARAQWGIAVGNIFPQTQTLTGEYSRFASSGVSGVGGAAAGAGGAGAVLTNEAIFNSRWNYQFNLTWELDFWGRFRRAVTAAEDNLQYACADYDAALVTMLGDVAFNYVKIRTDQTRIRLLQQNVDLQKGVLQFLERRSKAGFRTYDLDVDQAKSNLAQTESQIPPTQIDQRTASDALCVLLGIPPCDLVKRLGDGSIPNTPSEIGVGLPAELLRRRPDVVKAERLAAAQGEQIGIAEAQFYPAISINGALGYQANTFKRLFSDDAFSSSVGPSFQWNILNYGRIKNNVCLQDARLRELIYTYQQTVLQADQEVEDGLITLLKSREQAKLLAESVDASQKAVAIVIAQFQKGAVDFNRYALIEQNLVTQQDLQTQAQGAIAQGLILVYRALGGGWDIRCEGPDGEQAGLEAAPTPPETAPPSPNSPEVVPVPKPGPAVPEPNKKLSGGDPDDSFPVWKDPDPTEKTGDKPDE